MHAHGFPLLPHEITGVDCPGMIVPDVSGDTAEFVCNECKMIIGVLDVAYMRELASLLSTGALELTCPHCGGTNSFPELDSVDLFICAVCGKPVKAV
jgi:DNA-directed RNA polymerase subunit RPC12/RpoP